MAKNIADIIFRNGRVTTLNSKTERDRNTTAIAVSGERILKVGSDHDVISLKGSKTEEIDLHGRRVIPGLTDGHIHVIRGGLSYNMELRWDGIDSLAVGMRMLKKQAQNTPPPQWVRVVGGFCEHQFWEKRLPTLAELNEAAPDTPVFILHLYDRALLNQAAIRACGFTKHTQDPPGGIFERDLNGNPTGLLIAHPNATILYSTLAKGPKLPREYQINSTMHFMRELNRLGLTGLIDAGGGFQKYPEDYEVITQLSQEGKLTVRFAYNLFTQKPKQEFEDFSKWSKELKLGQGDNFYKLNGAGEMLVYSAADFEDFRIERPDMPPNMEVELDKVVRLLVENHWPFRMHATYNETISRALNVFENVNRENPFDGIHWFFDHAETITRKNIDRIKALGGGIAIQNRMAFQGEYFVERYGAEAAQHSPPIREMLRSGVPVGAGTDATRVSSYNPWLSLYWLVAGRTIGGLKIYPDENCLEREQALRLWTEANTWFTNEEGVRGQIAPNQLADFVALSNDYFSVSDEEIKDIISVLTVVGGKIVYGSQEFANLSPTLPPAMPDWSPVRQFGGFQERAVQRPSHAAREGTHHHDHLACGMHPQAKRYRSSIEEAVLDWSLGCQCWAF